MGQFCGWQIKPNLENETRNSITTLSLFYKLCIENSKLGLKMSSFASVCMQMTQEGNGGCSFSPYPRRNLEGSCANTSYLCLNKTIKKDH